jgi:hypothetical protein
VLVSDVGVSAFGFWIWSSEFWRLWSLGFLHLVSGSGLGFGFGVCRKSGWSK